MPTLTPTYYHAHIYFELSEQSQAQALRDHLAQSLPAACHIGQLIARAIGPHTRPMFEIDIPRAQHAESVAQIEAGRGQLSVLIHPVSDDELSAHTIDAQWLGTPLPLLLDRL